MLSRLPTDDESARWSRRRFTYWTRHPVNSDYAELWRLNHDSDSGSTTESESSSLFFDIGAQDRGTGYLDLGVTLVSPDEDLLAYSVDTAGDEVFELRFRDLRTGAGPPRPRAAQLLQRRLERRLAVVLLHRPRRRLPAVPGLAAPPRHRRRPTTCSCSRSRTRRFELVLRATRSGELVRDLPARAGRRARPGWSTLDAPESTPRSVGGRRHGVVYDVEHAPARRRPLLVVTNDDAVEFRLMHAPGARATPTRTTRPGPRRGPSTRTSGCSRADAFRRGGRPLLPGRRAAPAAHRRPRRPGRRRDRRAGAGDEVGCLDLAATGCTTPTRSPSATSPTCDRRSGRRWTCAPGTPPRCTAARRRASTPTPTVDGAPYLPGAGRHARAGGAPAAPRHPAGRHRRRR